MLLEQHRITSEVPFREGRMTKKFRANSYTEIPGDGESRGLFPEEVEIFLD